MSALVVLYDAGAPHLHTQAPRSHSVQRYAAHQSLLQLAWGLRRYTGNSNSGYHIAVRRATEEARTEIAHLAVGIADLAPEGAGFIVQWAYWRVHGIDDG